MSTSDRIIENMRLIYGHASKAQPTSIADVVRRQHRAEPPRQSPSDPITAADMAANMERVRDSADAVAAQSQRTPIGDAIRKQLRELS